MECFENIRLWEVRFQTVHPLQSLPMPHEIVLERQTSPAYHMQGRGRPENFTQIVCTLSGEGAFRYGNQVYRLLPGKGFICTLGDPESAYYYPGHAREPWIFLWMDFCNETAVRVLEELSERYGHVIDIPVDSEFVKYLKSFRNQRRSIRFVTPTVGARIVFDALAMLGEKLEQEDFSSKGSRLVQTAQAMITENLDRSLNLSEIAARLNVSREHLSRIFHEKTEMTPQKFAADERMRMAVRMLRDGILSCDEIAEKTGFSGSASFARAFRKNYGCTPSGYRKKLSQG